MAWLTLAIGCFKLCKRQWSERNFQLAKSSAWLLRSLQCLLQSSKNPLAIYSVHWWHDQLLCQIAIGFFKLCKRHLSERNNHAELFARWILRSLQCLFQNSKNPIAIYSVFWWHDQLLFQIGIGFSSFAKGIGVNAISNWRTTQPD